MKPIDLRRRSGRSRTECGAGELLIGLEQEVSASCPQIRCVTGKSREHSRGLRNLELCILRGRRIVERNVCTLEELDEVPMAQPVLGGLKRSHIASEYR